MNASYALAASMVNQLNRVANISNNLANLNTNGFKEERLQQGTFNNYLARAKKEHFKVSRLSAVENSVPKIDGKYIVEENGGVEQTGNRLDFSLNKQDTFFRLRGKNGKIYLSRNGAFKNLGGFLVNDHADNVLNVQGNPIQVQAGFEKQIVAYQTPYNNLSKYGNNDYKILDKSKLKYVNPAKGDITEGSLEKSNVNQMISMVDLIEAQRQFERNQKAITSINDMNSNVINKVGNNS